MRFVLVTVSLLLALTCIDRRSVFVNNLHGQFPTVSALLAIGCLQPPSSLASHGLSDSLQLLHRYTSVLVGVALFVHHPAEAKFQVVTERNIKDTSYYGSPVSLTNNDKDILITLDKHAANASITGSLNDYWQILLKKCGNNQNVEFEIANSCKWDFVWAPKFDLKLTASDGTVNTWTFPKKNPTPPLMELRIVIRTDDRTKMSVFPVTGDSFPPQIGDSLPLESPYCMLDTTSARFSVNVTLTDTDCPINVTIMDAKLLYDFYEPPTTLRVWTGPGSPPPGYAPLPTDPSNTSTTPVVGVTATTDKVGDARPPMSVIIGSAVGGVVLLALIVGGLVAFFVIRRRSHRRRHQEHFDDDIDDPNKIRKQIQQEEGLIEWTDLMAHAPYEPAKVEMGGLMKPLAEWPYARGDTVDLSSITASKHSKAEFKDLQFKGDIKGTEDYGVVDGRFDPKETCKDMQNRQADIYYSFPSDRVKAFVDRLSRLTGMYQSRKEAEDNVFEKALKKFQDDLTEYEKALKEGKEAKKPEPPTKEYLPLLRVPQLTHYWVSPDPEKFSYLVVHYSGKSVAQQVKDGVPFHQRCGFAFTTFAALSSIHMYGCVHRDVTPAAFMVRNEKHGDVNFVYITHLCLARFQYNTHDHTWMPRRRFVKYFGTYKYASRAAHAQQERSFKDDVESWFYTAVELIWPTKDDRLVMPWHFFNTEIGVVDSQQLHKKYKDAKDTFLRTFAQNKLIVNFPAAQFRIFAQDILKMTFETLEADYGYKFINFLYVMIEQLLTHADEASHQVVIDHIWNLNEFGCHDYRKFNFGPGVVRSPERSGAQKEKE